MWQSNGNNISYSRFQPGQPDGGVNENCLTMWIENGNWLDSTCMMLLGYNLCEKPTSSPPPPPPIIDSKYFKNYVYLSQIINKLSSTEDIVCIDILLGLNII